jgi:hypothetical protein
MMGGRHLLLLAALVGAFSQVAAASESTLSLSVLQRKLQPVLQLLEKDCLSELIAVRDSKGGLADGLEETKIFLAVARGQPADLFRSGNKKLVKAAMNDPEIRVAFGQTPADPTCPAKPGRETPRMCTEPETMPPPPTTLTTHDHILVWGEDLHLSCSTLLSRISIDKCWKATHHLSLYLLLSSSCALTLLPNTCPPPEKVLDDSLSDDGDNDDGWVDFHGTKEAWKVLSGANLSPPCFPPCLHILSL